jgi:uncharacterized protein YndB with AHSA1/START domain
VNFQLEERDPDWSAGAPIRIRHSLFLPVPPASVFAVLADSEGWPRWFRGMRRVRIDGQDRGAGVVRTVWVGPTRVQEHFTVWEPDTRIVLHVVRSSSPGLRVMAEDYQISPVAGGSTLAITVGVEAKGPFRLLPGVVRFVVGRLSGGVLGITTAFPPESSR